MPKTTRAATEIVTSSAWLGSNLSVLWNAQTSPLVNVTHHVY